MVQPDLVFVGTNKLKSLKRGLEAAPDLAVEVLSPSTARVDRVRKLNTFASHGVPYYWLADDQAHTLEAYRLRDGL